MPVYLCMRGDCDNLIHEASGAPVFVLVVTAVVFAESGLLAGFFLPGDSLLFSAGLIAALEGRMLHPVAAKRCRVRHHAAIRALVRP